MYDELASVHTFAGPKGEPGVCGCGYLVQPNKAGYEFLDRELKNIYQ